MSKEWNKLTHLPAWDAKNAKPKPKVIPQAKKQGRTVHLQRIVRPQAQLRRGETLCRRPIEIMSTTSTNYGWKQGTEVSRAACVDAIRGKYVATNMYECVSLQ